MDADHDKHSELQRMLAAKKHAAPPTRALKGFSESVIDRLQKPEPPPEMTFREQVEHLVESKPVLVCLSGLVVFGCLAAGLVASLRVKPPQVENALINQDDKSIVAPSAGGGREASGQSAADSRSDSASGDGQAGGCIRGVPVQRNTFSARPGTFAPGGRTRRRWKEVGRRPV